MEDNKMEEKINMVQSLLKKITDDGKITEEEVNELRKHLLNEDGSYNINRKVADGLFNLLNTAKNKEVIDDSFGELFIDAVFAYLLKDKSSTGVLDDKEVDWLVGKIESNLEIDDTIVALITKLQEGSYNSFPEKLDSAIILRRLRRILDQFSNSETDNSKEEFEESITSLNEFMERRKKVSIDEDCVTILFSIKKKLIQNKRLGFDIAKNLDKEGTAEHKFAKLFYDIVSAYVLYDKHSPYDIDDKEAKRLMARINQKATADSIDKALLDQLNNKSMGFPEMLAKARFDICTSEVRTEVVNVLVRGHEEAKAKAKKNLDGYLAKSFGCTDELKLKAELLFDLKNLTKKNDFKEGAEEEDIEHHIQNIYVEQVTKYITGAESQRPNEIDGENEKWLNERLKVSESRYYECDEELLRRLKDSSVNFPESLEERLSKVIMKRIFFKLKTQGETLNNTYVKELRDAIFNDNDEFKIDPKEAAEFIFRIKDIVYERNKKINKELSKFFVKVVSLYLLGDKKSPGKIDKAETEWLLARINQNLKTDKYDKALLKELEDKSINHPNVLHFTGWWKNGCRQALYISRKMSWIAIWVSIIASLFLFIKGAAHVFYAGKSFIQCEPVMVVDSTQLALIKSETGLTGDTILVKKISLQDKKLKHVRNIQLVASQDSLLARENAVLGISNPSRVAENKIIQQDSIQLIGISDVKGNVGYRSALSLKMRSIKLEERKRIKGFETVKSEETFVEIVEAIDSFLVAIVVFILGIGIFELFIRKMEKPYKVNEKRPSWMQMNSIDDLKSSLVKVLIIAMIVGFYKKTLSPSFDEKNLLFSAIGIVLIAIAFCVTEISAHYHHKSKAGDNTNEENKAKEDKHNKDDNNKKEK